MVHVLEHDIPLIVLLLCDFAERVTKGGSLQAALGELLARFSANGGYPESHRALRYFLTAPDPGELAESLSRSLRKDTKGHALLIDSLIDILGEPSPGNVLVGDTLETLSKMLLTPDECKVAKLNRGNQHCAACGKTPLCDGLLLTRDIEGYGGYVCTKCAVPRTGTCPNCEKNHFVEDRAFFDAVSCGCTKRRRKKPASVLAALTNPDIPWWAPGVPPDPIGLPNLDHEEEDDR